MASTSERKILIAIDPSEQAEHAVKCELHSVRRLIAEKDLGFTSCFKVGNLCQ